VIHGDTHKLRFDSPLQEPQKGGAPARFVRLEVPGSPKVAGVWVSIDPEAEKPFAVELVYPDTREPMAE
jgi:hypothetical protein